MLVRANVGTSVSPENPVLYGYFIFLLSLGIKKRRKEEKAFQVILRVINNLILKKHLIIFHLYIYDTFIYTFIESN